MSLRVVNETSAPELFGIAFPRFREWCDSPFGHDSLSPAEADRMEAYFAAGGSVGRLSGGGYIAGPKRDVEAAIIGSMMSGRTKRQ